MSTASRKEIGAWALYDFANQGFPTLIITVIFSVYFVQVVAPDPATGERMWLTAINVSSILVALLMPILGAIADYSGRKKLLLLMTTVQCIIFTALLYFAGPGMAAYAIILFVMANIAFEASYVFYNAFLPEISTPRNIGRISGYGWSAGYLGGLAALIAALFVMRLLPETDNQNVRATILLVAGWFAIFSIPVFLLLRERSARRTASLAQYTIGGFRRLAGTFRQLRDYREAVKLLIARLVYNDGLVVIFSLAGIYTAAVLGMTQEQIVVMFIAILVSASIGAFIFGFINDWIGGKWTIAITLVVLIAAALIGITATTPAQFWVAALLIGLMAGPNQAASRSLMGTFIPTDKQAELYGFYSFSGKLAAVMGPLAYNILHGVFQSHRVAMSSTLLFFSVGLLLLLAVDEHAGIRNAEKLSRQTKVQPETAQRYTEHPG